MELTVKDTIILLGDLLMLQEYKYGHDDEMYMIMQVYEHLRVLLESKVN